MPYQRPTVSQLMVQQEVDLSAQLNIAQAQVRRSNAGVLAKVQAGGLHGVYGYLGYLIEQQFEDTAEDEYLLRRGNIRDIPQKAATQSSGERLFNGSPGAQIPANTLLQRADGVRFIVTTGITLNEQGSGSAVVQAEEAGSLANTESNEPLQLVTPIAGVETQSLSGQISGGTDTETVASYRARVLEYIREPPHGGAGRDYLKWAKECPTVDVGRVWLKRKWMGAGTVGVFFTLADGSIPTAEHVAAVQEHIEDEAPVTADVFVIAPSAVSVPIEISNLTPDTPAVRAAVAAELQDLFNRSAQLEDGTGSATVLLSHIREAVSVAAGEGDHVIDLPTENVTFTKGQLPQFGGVTWK